MEIIYSPPPIYQNTTNYSDTKIRKGSYGSRWYPSHQRQKYCWTQENWNLTISSFGKYLELDSVALLCWQENKRVSCLTARLAGSRYPAPSQAETDLFSQSLFWTFSAHILELSRAPCLGTGHKHPKGHHRREAVLVITQWHLYRSIRSWSRIHRVQFPHLFWATVGNISSILPISTFMCIFIYAYLHKNNVRRSLILLGSHLSTPPIQLLGAKLHCWIRLNFSFLFCLLSLISLKIISFIYRHVYKGVFFQATPLNYYISAA